VKTEWFCSTERASSREGERVRSSASQMAGERVRESVRAEREAARGNTTAIVTFSSIYLYRKREIGDNRSWSTRVIWSQSDGSDRLYISLVLDMHCETFDEAVQIYSLYAGWDAWWMTSVQHGAVPM